MQLPGVKSIAGRAPLLTSLCAASVVLAGCATLRVTSDVNTPVITQVQCHTFSWAGAFHGNDALRGSVANPVNESRLRAAIQANLGTVGVQPATAEPDCLGWGRGYYGGWWGWDYPYVYNEGMIGVDLYDAKSKQALWHASVDQNLANVTGDKADQRIKDAVAAIFTKYPKS
jgi:opacity protein-like surface antigen